MRPRRFFATPGMVRRPGLAVRPLGFLALLLATALTACGSRTTSVPARGYVAGASGARIYYELSGAGSDTVIVVHGGPGAGMNDIRPDLGPLARNNVVIYYDQRGGGRSELPGDTTRLAARYFIDDLEAVRAHFGLQRVALLAHSFGAIIAAEYARVHPGRVSRLIFLAATGPSRQEAARFYRSLPPVSDTVTARRQYGVLSSLMDGTAPDPVAACREYEDLGRRLAAGRGAFVGLKGTTCDMPADAVRYYYRYTATIGPEGFGDWDYTRSLRQLPAPLLVVDGERDSVGLAMEHAWARAVANGRLLVVSRAGRAAYAERPDIVFPAIDSFLRGRWPDAAVAPASGTNGGD